jgi:uncharacterized membrane protein YdjX (TVP38/TMEM64 family)
LISEVELVDPVKPWGVERVIDEFRFRGGAARELTLAERVPTGLLMTLFFCVVLAWLRFMTPLSPYLRDDAYRMLIASLGVGGTAELWFLVGFVALGTLCVPLNLLIILAACLFPAAQAFALGLIGSVAVAALGYGVGRIVAAKGTSLGLGRLLYYLRQAFARHSTLAVFLVRFFPIAPYGLINTAAGSARVDVVPYLVGTTLGLLPGLTALVAFHSSLLHAIAHPGAGASLQFALVVLAIAAVFYLLARRLARVGGPAAAASRDDAPAVAARRAGYAS